ncbi:hypothetical protein LPB03_12055 [Polaribacter vadi]|uniref:RteC domain-containing protein n=1 Tax=Polaribacter vadi TaxID=1774273 RepID=UPI000806D85A|nr:RteC domain-containing protein [Polaribacter vadi]AOW18140.1 hypothetical protein LPB03_12055 [Polaribacter vadi]
MKNCYKLIYELEHNLKVLKCKINNLHCLSEQSILLCKSALENLRNSFKEYTFKSKKEEIEFYKYIKPKVFSYLIFYVKQLQIESKRSIEGKKEQIKYLKKYIAKLQTYFNNNLEFYHYFKSNAAHLDEQYFLRENKSLRINIEEHYFFTEDEFSTSHDSSVATIMAYIKLIEYLKNEIDKLNNLHQNVNPIKPLQKENQLNWTGSKTDLVELIYALQKSGAINNGTADVKEIASTLEQHFNINLGNYYHTFMEIKLRKNITTKFIEKLKESLILRIKESDE